MYVSVVLKGLAVVAAGSALTIYLVTQRREGTWLFNLYVADPRNRREGEAIDDAILAGRFRSAMLGLIIGGAFFTSVGVFIVIAGGFGLIQP
jgi:hypothetical protein